MPLGRQDERCADRAVGIVLVAPERQFLILIQINSTINYLPAISAATTLLSQRQAEPALCELRAHRQSV